MLKKETKEFVIKTQVKISLQRISDLLCGALEGGSNYWYNIERFVPPSTELEYRTDPEVIFKHLDYPLNEGGALIIVDKEEEDSTERYTLNLESIEKGLKTMAKKYPRHFTDFLNENDDAITSDVFLQCCLFGKTIYG